MRKMMKTDNSNMHISSDAAASDIDNAAKYTTRDCPSDSAFTNRIMLLTFLGAHMPDLSLKMYFSP